MHMQYINAHKLGVTLCGCRTRILANDFFCFFSTVLPRF